MTSQPILLRGGTLLLHHHHHDDDDGNGNGNGNYHVKPTRADLLIEGNTITKIGENISASSAREVDCTSKIISPGFISTHAHLWQTQLKGSHPNHTLVEYMPCGNYSGTLYELKDLFWGQLSGAMESVDAGTTTVVDHSHINLGPDYPKTAIQALATSGLRAIYCPVPERHTTSFNPLTVSEEDNTSPSVLDKWAQLASTTYPDRQGQGQGGRVVLGFAMDNLFLPPAQLQAFYGRLRGSGHDGGGGGGVKAQVITSHAVGGPGFGGRPYAVGMLDRAGLLGRDVILSHAPGLADEDVLRLRETGASVSSTPNTEMQMGMEPVSMWRSALGGEGVGGGIGIGSLGVDCHTWGTSSMATQMNLMLQQRRLVRAQELAREGGRWPRHVEGSVEEVFNLATLAGARAVGMEGEIGQLRVGYRADLVVFDGTSPGMMCAAAEDPVAAVALHSSIRDVDMVIVDGVVRKEAGRLCEVTVEAAPEGLVEQTVSVGTRYTWQDVARHTLESREVIKGRMEGIGWGPAEEAVIDGWHMNRSTMVDK